MCKSCGWEAALKRVQKNLADQFSHFNERTLEEYQALLKREKHITEKQTEHLNDICTQREAGNGVG